MSSRAASGPLQRRQTWSSPPPAPFCTHRAASEFWRPSTAAFNCPLQGLLNNPLRITSQAVRAIQAMSDGKYLGTVLVLQRLLQSVEICYQVLMRPVSCVACKLEDRLWC